MSVLGSVAPDHGFMEQRTQPRPTMLNLPFAEIRSRFSICKIDPLAPYGEKSPTLLLLMPRIQSPTLAVAIVGKSDDSKIVEILPRKFDPRAISSIHCFPHEVTQQADSGIHIWLLDRC